MDIEYPGRDGGLASGDVNKEVAELQGAVVELCSKLRWALATLGNLESMDDGDEEEMEEFQNECQSIRDTLSKWCKL